MFFSGVGGEPSYYFWVPYSGGQGGVPNIQDGGFGVREFHAEEETYRFYGQGHHPKGESQDLEWRPQAEHQLTLEKDDQLLGAKEKLKTIAARSVEAFQQTDEYNTMLFSWYFKGFELLRRYLVKHPTGVDLENLDLEEVDKEMAIDKAV